MHHRISRLLTFTFLLVAAAVSACAHTYIEGTQIPDTAENREVMEVVGKVREALEKRDKETLLSMVSPSYFEDNGTVDAKDDYGYVDLKEHILHDSLDITKEMYLSFDIHEVVVDGNQAHADVRYVSRARIALPSGSLWDTQRDFDRIELRREDGNWRVVSGL